MSCNFLCNLDKIVCNSEGSVYFARGSILLIFKLPAGSFQACANTMGIMQALLSYFAVLFQVIHRYAWNNLG